MLDILIPTYNRSEFLIKNLNLLYDIIKKANLDEQITVIVSNNGSPDDTQEVVDNFKETHKLNLIAFKQKENLGVKANVLFLLKESKSEYVMFLGDDDYFSYDYFMECIDIINKDSNTYVIIPNHIPVSVTGEPLAPPRDKMGSTVLYKPGFSTLLENSYRGHQISGLTLKREGLLDVYLKNGVDNLYQFIYFTSIWCLKGNVYRISNLPVEVTQPIKVKDWSYGDDGLVNEIFDNYKRLPISYFQRYLLEANFFVKQPWRLMRYLKMGNKAFFTALRKIWFAPNASFLFSFTFLLLLLIAAVRKIFYKPE